MWWLKSHEHTWKILSRQHAKSSGLHNVKGYGGFQYYGPVTIITWVCGENMTHTKQVVLQGHVSNEL